MMQIASKQCDQCLFSKNKIVSDSRKEELVADLIKRDKFFECHKGTLAGKHVVCAGYFKRYGESQQSIQVAQRLEKMTGEKFIELVNPMEL